MNNNDRVLIAGGGPVGLITALALGRAGIPVTVFERFEALQDDPRAATTHPATLEALASLGLEEEVRARGLVCPVFQFWDRPTGELVAEFDHALLKDETDFPYVVQCEQFKTAQITLERLRELSNVEVHFNAEVIGVEASVNDVRLTVRHKNSQDEVYQGRYLVGADGGRSTVRKAMEIPFDGFTWPERFVVYTTPFDFAAERGYSSRSYFADPDEWCNCFKVSADGPPGLWRTVFPGGPDLSDDALVSEAEAQARLQKFFPKGGDYEVVHRNIYRVHQRVAKTFRKGRVLLAGDAAHVNNPIGGMGLNGGIQDAVNLADKLIEVYRGADDSLLDLYSLQRRTLTEEVVQAQTIQNKKRLETREPEERRRNLDELRAMAADPVLAKEFLMRTSMLAGQRRVASLKLSS